DNTVRTPVLNEEEEQFLKRITNEEPEGTPPPLPARPVVILDNGQEIKGKDAQIALMDGADKVPLPKSPPVDSEGKALVDGEQEKEEKKKKRTFVSYLPALPGRFTKVLLVPSSLNGKDKEQAASNLHAAAEVVKSGDGNEVEKEQEDLSAILDQLSLSAVNNRVFSFSKESQELLDRFKLVLKDIVNGAPTAYDDLEKLLTHSESQLTKMYGSLPPFLQNLVKSLPGKMTATLAPEILAAASEKPQVHGLNVPESNKSGQKRKSKRSRIPTLKTLISEQGAVATMLRSILNFLKLRFPAFVTGTNVLMSLAVFLLLFVFWYCHKRGRETRLERERLATESSESELEDSIILEPRETVPTESSETKTEEKPRGEGEEVTPPLIIHPEPLMLEEKCATVADMPSVLNMPEPS
ncbi:hypothetical protein K432DRAFT_275655, partial [Lepidopterella palustris CBS 459.81]